MDPLTLGIIMGGGSLLGLAKSELVDRPKENRQRHLAAETQRYSPWTGLQAGAIKEADPLGSALQYGTTAGSMYSGFKSAQASDKLTNAMSDYYKQGGMGSGANIYAPSVGFGDGPTQGPWTQMRRNLGTGG